MRCASSCVAPETLAPDNGDVAALAQAERSRSLRIALLQAGYNTVAVLPADMFLPHQLAQIQPGHGDHRCR